jgi:hypothetical protein
MFWFLDFALLVLFLTGLENSQNSTPPDSGYGEA